MPARRTGHRDSTTRLNESPSEKEGKFCDPNGQPADDDYASMKVPPKRKGNTRCTERHARVKFCLNESPSEKEGKWAAARLQATAS